MKRLMGKIAVAAVMVAAVVLVAGVVSAQLFPPGPGPTQTPSGATAITSGPGDKGFPAISGNTIVWLDNSTMSVQVYDAASGRSMAIPGNSTYAVVSMRQVDVSGNYVVWTGLSAATMSSDIYLYDTARGSVTPLTNDPVYQALPSISGNFVGWVNLDMATGRGEIYWYNIANGHTGSLLENASINQIFPTAGGGFITWLDDRRASGHADLCWVSLTKGDLMRYVASGNVSSPPAVSSDGRWIVWVVEKARSPVLYMLDTTTEKVQQIAGEGAMPANPAVDGNYVVWTDYRNGNGDIYLYDIQSGQERQITSDSAEQMFPDISNGRIVWMGNNDGAWNIYSASIGGGAQPTYAPTYAPTGYPTYAPTGHPTYAPTGHPTYAPRYSTLMGEAGNASPLIEMNSSAFANGTSIPVRYTCDGDNVSPPLSWSGVPDGTESLALIVDDPDAPGGNFTHWVIYNISPEESGLAEGLPRERDLPGGMHQGNNSLGTTGYIGPCPPRGPAHHYVFHLYALNATPDLPATVDRAVLEAEIQNYTVAEGVLVGTYGR
ncbi:MAG: YbhB/YbcL family Raf kinase inhibitor-like protein [Methanomicrobiaceae archaeon]|nr:YbhB/YbcL family Raf kinase inhibitor-like protein [Methanomicrobiaceae archaeon]